MYRMRIHTSIDRLIDITISIIDIDIRFDSIRLDSTDSPVNDLELMAMKPRHSQRRVTRHYETCEQRQLGVAMQQSLEVSTRQIL